MFGAENCPGYVRARQQGWTFRVGAMGTSEILQRLVESYFLVGLHPLDYVAEFVLTKLRKQKHKQEQNETQPKSQTNQPHKLLRL